MKRFISFVLAVLMISGAFAVLSYSAEYEFSDVPQTSWCYRPVRAACRAGLFAGTGETTFDPDKPMTRAMVVTVLAKMSGQDISGFAGSRFADVPAGAWYEKPVCWAHENGIVSGTDAAHFSPDALITREQICVILSKYAESYPLAADYKYDCLHFDDASSISDWAFTAVENMQMYGAVRPRGGLSFSPKSSVSRAEVCNMLVYLNGDTTNSAKDTTVRVMSFAIDNASLELQTGDTAVITGMFSPANADIRTVTFTSGNTSAAKVDGTGKVTAVGAGTAIITAVCLDGSFRAQCTVKVTDPPEPEPRQRYIDPNKPMVALTFDDGPNKTYTNRILDTLEKYGVTATFFEVGQMAEANPAVLRRELALNCEIGNHSYSHPQLTKLTYSQVVSEITSTNEIIRKYTGYTPKLMRPPYGSATDSTGAAVNMPMIIWSIDTLDWKTRNADSTYNSVINNVRDGSIVLMHSLYEPTANAVARMVPKLISMGYQIVTVSEMAEARGVRLKNGVKYYSFYK